MATLSPQKANELGADLGLIQEAVRSGVTSKRANAADNHWERWASFCLENNFDPYLRDVEDPVPLLQVFGQRYRDGRIAPSGRAVRSRTVEDAIRAVGQTFASVGSKDVRKDAHGGIDFRLKRQLRGYKKADAPPHRVKPIPVTLILHIIAMAFGAAGTVAKQAIADMIVIAFFFLLRPGEYTGTSSDDAPFRMCDVSLFLGSAALNVITAPLADIAAATSGSLTFTDQKNGTKGEIINHGRSGHPYCCPTEALKRRIIYLRQQGASAETPIATYYVGRRKHAVKSGDITDTLRGAATFLHATTGIAASDISARSLRAGGAMALLCGEIDANTIRLLGRWHSDAMMRYLHLQAQPVMRHFASTMFNHGTYSFNPNDLVPAAA